MDHVAILRNAIVKKKNKILAILFTFFFGFWGWLYTYHVDKKSFG